MISVRVKDEEIVSFHEWHDIKRELARLNYILACCYDDREAINKVLEEVPRDRIEVDGKQLGDDFPTLFESFRIESWGEHGEISYVYIENCEVIGFDIEGNDCDYTLYDSITKLPSIEAYSKRVAEFIERAI